jgi:hypothetical protein
VLADPEFSTATRVIGGDSHGCDRSRARLDNEKWWLLKRLSHRASREMCCVSGRNRRQL